KELLQRRIHIFFIVDAHTYKPIFVLQSIIEDRKQRSGRTPVTRRALFANLAVTKKIAGRDQLISKLHRLFVVGIVVIAIREVEWIDVPVTRAVALLDHVKRKLISRRNHGSARFSLREELLFRHFFRLGVMRNENDVDVVVLRSQETDHPEIKATRDILLKFAHRA